MVKFVSFVLVALRLAVLVVDHTLTIVGNVSAQQDQHFSCCREMGGKNIRNVNLSVTINFPYGSKAKAV